MANYKTLELLHNTGFYGTSLPKSLESVMMRLYGNAPTLSANQGLPSERSLTISMSDAQTNWIRDNFPGGNINDYANHAVGEAIAYWRGLSKGVVR